MGNINIRLQSYDMENNITHLSYQLGMTPHLVKNNLSDRQIWGKVIARRQTAPDPLLSVIGDLWSEPHTRLIK